jgi:hypothetical protein
MTFGLRARCKLICGLFAIGLGLASTVLAQEPKGEEPQPPKIIRKSGGVLQGSATKRVEPVYPPLAKAALYPCKSVESALSVVYAAPEP